MIKKKPGRKSVRPSKEQFEMIYSVNSAKQTAAFFNVSVYTVYSWAYQFRKEDSS